MTHAIALTQQTPEQFHHNKRNQLNLLRILFYKCLIIIFASACIVSSLAAIATTPRARFCPRFPTTTRTLFLSYLLRNIILIL
jgi:hypothetical protein